MTPEILAGTAGIVLSLLFSYIPGLNVKYAALTSQYKSLIMLGILFVISGAVFGFACAGWLQDLFGLSVTCDKAGILALLKVFFAAVIANQATYLASPQTQKVTEAKESR